MSSRLTSTTLLTALMVCLSFGLQAGQVSTQGTGRSPVVRVLKVPDYPGAYAIWGATGVDSRGHVWIGLTSGDSRSGSAHLFEYDAISDIFTDRGNVVAELTRLGIRRPGEIQMKIHSRIVQASDQYQYFSSMDESGEAGDGSKLPTWGGHLWRRGPTGRWEHLAATPEALIAVASGGPFVYALGYFNHVLYQFDTRTKRLRSVAVGSAGGHVSRNFFVDSRGHAYVPRVVRADHDKATAFLVEFDSALRELSAQPLEHYLEGHPDASHGIVAVHPGSEGTWVFATSKGRLYEVEPAGTGPATLKDLGWFHPGGSRYVASMFRDERTGTLYGVSLPNGDGTTRFEWVTHASNGTSTAAPFPYGDAVEFPASAVLYGSITRDSKGRFYVVGTMNFKPLVLQVTPAVE